MFRAFVASKLTSKHEWIRYFWIFPRKAPLGQFSLGPLCNHCQVCLVLKLFLWSKISIDGLLPGTKSICYGSQNKRNLLDMLRKTREKLRLLKWPHFWPLENGMYFYLIQCIWARKMHNLILIQILWNDQRWDPLDILCLQRWSMRWPKQVCQSIDGGINSSNSFCSKENSNVKCSNWKCYI